MNAIEKKIEWKTGSGKAAIVAISLQTSETAYCDGDEHELACCKLHTTAEVSGMGYVGFEISRKPVTVAGTTYHATIGKLVIPAAPLAEIDEALAEIYATPDWKAKEAAEAAKKVADAKFRQSSIGKANARTRQVLYGDKD